MPALPADIAKYTTDGVVLTSSNPSIATNFPDAIDGAGDEIEMFYDEPADAQVMLDELFVIRSTLAPTHIAVEVEEGLGLGTSIPDAPQLPCFQVVDEPYGIDETLRVISYAYAMGSDRRTVELHK